MSLNLAQNNFSLLSAEKTEPALGEHVKRKDRVEPALGEHVAREQKAESGEQRPQHCYIS